jgi:hypothetical protein
VEMPPYGDEERILHKAPSAGISGRLSTSHEWFATTPIELVLRDGVVQRLDVTQANWEQ